MFDMPPSRAQLRYLANLGYVDPVPLMVAEASIAIGEMLKTGDSAAAQKAILADRAAREALARHAETDSQAGPVEGVSSQWFGAFLILLSGYVAAAACWIVSRVIAALAWVFSSLAIVLIWLPSQAGLLAARKAAVKVETGRQKVVPWLGAGDWRNMAAGCRVQAFAAAKQVDALLVQASRNDRWLLLTLRFATAAAAAIICVALIWIF